MDPHNQFLHLQMGATLLLLPKVTDPSAAVMLPPLTSNMANNDVTLDE
jgi:hypothetical protein